MENETSAPLKPPIKAQAAVVGKKNAQGQIAKPQVPQSRDQHEPHHGRGVEGREATEAHLDYDEFDPSLGAKALPDIPPRPGFTQRWQRVAEPSLGMAVDGQNISRRHLGMWTPRAASSVDRRFHMLTRLPGSETQDAIVVREMMLVERPVKVQARREAFLAEKNDKKLHDARFSKTQDSLPGNGQFMQKFSDESATGKRAVHMASEA